MRRFQVHAAAPPAAALILPRGAMSEQKMQGLAERLEKSLQRGRDHAIVLAAEGVQAELLHEAGPSHALAFSAPLLLLLGQPVF